LTRKPDFGSVKPAISWNLYPLEPQAIQARNHKAVVERCRQVLIGSAPKLPGMVSIAVEDLEHLKNIGIFAT